MKVVIFTFAYFLSFSLFAQTNVGFAKAGNMTNGEGLACQTWDEAIDRFIAGAENPVVGKFMAERATLAMRNAGQTLSGNTTMSQKDVVWVLGWVKSHPKDTTDLFISVYKLPKGNYTFETLTKKSDGSWILGQQITRSAHEDEWVLELFGTRIVTSWCLNLFPTTGKVVEPEVSVSKPTFSYQENTKVVRNSNLTFDYDTRVVANERVIYHEPDIVSFHMAIVTYRPQSCRTSECGPGFGSKKDVRLITNFQGEPKVFFYSSQELQGMQVGIPECGPPSGQLICLIPALIDSTD